MCANSNVFEENVAQRKNFYRPPTREGGSVRAGWYYYVDGVAQFRLRAGGRRGEVDTIFAGLTRSSRKIQHNDFPSRKTLSLCRAREHSQRRCLWQLLVPAFWRAAAAAQLSRQRIRI